MTSAAPNDATERAPDFWLEHDQLFAHSALWSLQRDYFLERGIDAWREPEVPHYITSNPSIARCFAAIALAVLQDHRRLHPSVDDDQPLSVCELGAGTGRFAFHFLTELERMCAEADIPLRSFRYILTDIAATTIDFWRRHASLAPFFEAGVLDAMVFDITDPALVPGGFTGYSQRPLVVIANYVFDSIPTDLVYIEQNTCHDGLVSLRLARDPAALAAADVLAEVQADFTHRRAAQSHFREAYLQTIIDEYRAQLDDAYVLMPAQALRGLERLRTASPGGLVLLAADKGQHRIDRLESHSPPTIVKHGSFSLEVNFHAIARYFEHNGGMAFFPPDHTTVNVGCLLLPEAGPHTYRATRQAFQTRVVDFGPDDFFSIARQAQRGLAELTVSEILAHVRLSGDDPHRLARFLPRLVDLAPTMSRAQRSAVREAVDRAWERYFPFGETFDLAYHLGFLLYEMDHYAEALRYFQLSTDEYGPFSGTLYNMAVCCVAIGQPDQSRELLLEVVRHDPQNEAARDLLGALARPG